MGVAPSLASGLLLYRMCMGGRVIKPEVETRCAKIADMVVPQYRNGEKSYSCTGGVAKRWLAAFEGARMALDHDPKDITRPVESSQERE